MVGLMLLSLHLYGEITVVGRQGGERLWDLTDRWWPETATVSMRDADRVRDERHFRNQGVRLVKGEWEAHPDAVDGPVPTVPSSSRRSTGSSTTATAPRRSGAFATG